MGYEVINIGTHADPNIINIACPSIDALCVGVNVVCPAIDGECGSINAICGGDADSNCDGGNVYPCENPGFGCRSGCGGAVATNCVEPVSV